MLVRLLEGGQSLNDFGAGVGEYGHELKAVNESIAWHGYDGAGNIEEYTSGFVRFFDLTIPLSLPRADWVLSLEVGEHISQQFEAQYIRNLDAHNCRGIIGSWAPPKQAGTGHINRRNKTYVLERFVELGYRVDEQLQTALVTARSHHGGFDWPLIRKNIFAVVRDRPSCVAELS